VDYERIERELAAFQAAADELRAALERELREAEFRVGQGAAAGAEAAYDAALRAAAGPHDTAVPAESIWAPLVGRVVWSYRPGLRGGWPFPTSARALRTMVSLAERLPGAADHVRFELEVERRR
jgi:hypothetical protein